MPRKPRRPAPLLPPVALAVKDGLRDLRVNLRQGAQSLASRIEATSHRLDGVEGPLGRLPRLGEPLAVAVRTAVQIIETADHAAVDMLSSDGDYRRLDFRLRPAAHHFRTPAEPGELQRAFTKTLYWTLRHLLQRRGAADVVVHEQAVAQAWQEVAGQPPGASDADWAAAALLALCRAEQPALLHRAADDAPAAAERRLSCGAAAVLAGELARLCPDAVAETETRRALAMADEIVLGTLAEWRLCLAAPQPRQALAQQVAFTLRHV
jgi:hypothetical protein